MDIEKLFNYNTFNKNKDDNLIFIEIANLTQQRDDDVFSKLNKIKRFSTNNIKNELILKWVVGEYEIIKILIECHLNQKEYLFDDILKHLQIIQMFINKGVNYEICNN